MHIVKFYTAYKTPFLQKLSRLFTKAIENDKIYSVSLHIL